MREQPVSFSTATLFQTAGFASSGPGGESKEAAELKAKVLFLSDPSSYHHGADQVIVKETHMSWVFLVGERVYKLKKPVRYPYLDFTTLKAREKYCREEVRLNSRLAPGVYRGVIPLMLSSTGRLSVDGEGEIVDWLVAMNRLPADCMLDMRLEAEHILDQDVERLAQVLANFYRHAKRPSIDPELPFRHFTAELVEDKAVLLRAGLLPDQRWVSLILNQIEAALIRVRETLRSRVLSGHIVDGHGDLRPEHICLCDPIVIFDCLEFNRDLRLVDPFDELAFLDMECTRIGASWLGRRLISRVAELMGEVAPEELLAVYSALHAALRARLSIAHLLDPVPREPQKWAPLARQYLTLAEDALSHPT